MLSSEFAVFLLITLVANSRGGVLYHRQHSDDAALSPQQNYIDDGVRVVKITRTIAVPLPVQVPVQVPIGHNGPLVLAHGHQLVPLVPRLALIPQHYQEQGYPLQGYLPIQHPVQRVPPTSDSKPAYSKQQHEQSHYGHQRS